MGLERMLLKVRTFKIVQNSGLSTVSCRIECAILGLDKLLEKEVLKLLFQPIGGSFPIPLNTTSLSNV
jgi:hypothetical protein